MKERQQNSTSYPTCFLMVSSTDHVTPVTGLTPTVTLSKNGGAFASPSGAVTEIGSGWYALAGNATDRNTLGDFIIHATGTGADPVDDRYSIVAYNPFDSVRMGLTALPNAAADAAGGLPISDAGALDLDSKLANTNEITAARMGALTDWIDGGRLDLLLDALLTRLSETRAGYIDYLANGSYGLNALLTAINSRLAASGYTAPDNTGVGNIYGIVNSGTHGNAALLTAIGLCLQASGYTAPANTNISTILTAIQHATYGLSALRTALDLKLDTSGYTAPDNTNIGNVHTIVSSAVHGNAALKTLVDSVKALTDRLNAMLEDAGAYDRFLPTALEEAPGGGTGGDATAANQTIIINHLVGIKGATFSESTDSLEAIRDRGDAAWLTGGGSAGSNTVTITVHDGSGNNLVGVHVDVFDSGNTSLQGRVDTNSSGVAVHNLDNGTYTLRLVRSGYTFTAVQFTVSGNYTHTYVMTAYVIPASSDPALCLVYTKLRIPGNAYPSSVVATATAAITPLEGSDSFIGGAMTGTYDPVEGVVSWELERGLDFHVVIDGYGVDDDITVPDAASADLKTLIA